MITNFKIGDSFYIIDSSDEAKVSGSGRRRKRKVIVIGIFYEGLKPNWKESYTIEKSLEGKVKMIQFGAENRCNYLGCVDFTKSEDEFIKEIIEDSKLLPEYRKYEFPV